MVFRTSFPLGFAYPTGVVIASGMFNDFDGRQYIENNLYPTNLNVGACVIDLDEKIKCIYCSVINIVENNDYRCHCCGAPLVYG